MVQALLFVLSLSAVWLIGCDGRRQRRAGFMVGMLSQPLWIWESWRAGQGGIFIMSIIYIFVWARGIKKA